jgi:lipoyl(octanoyl) transferase
MSTNVENWGLVDYRQALTRQEEMVAAVAKGGAGDTLVFCSHPPVVTVGRVTPPSDFAGWKGELVEVSRGGRATYHGPNQIVVYPIVNLQREGRNHLPPRDLHAFLRGVGESVVRAMRDFDIKAEYRQGEDLSADANSRRHLTGVWVGERKLASLGVAARQWVSYHGLALNLAPDPAGFGAIQPCGFTAQTMTSMAEVLGRAPAREDVEEMLRRQLEDFLQFKL